MVLEVAVLRNRSIAELHSAREDERGRGEERFYSQQQIQIPGTNIIRGKWWGLEQQRVYLGLQEETD